MWTKNIKIKNYISSAKYKFLWSPAKNMHYYIKQIIEYSSTLFFFKKLYFWVIYISFSLSLPNTGWPRSYHKYMLQITQHSQYGYAKLQYRFAVTSGSPSTIIWPIESFIFFTTATMEKKYWVNQKSVFYLQTLRKYSDTKLLLCSLKWLQGYILCIRIIHPPPLPNFEIHFFIDVPSVQEVVTHFIL